MENLSGVDVAYVVQAIMNGGTVRATKYVSNKLIIRATRRLFQGKIAKNGEIEMVLTIGKPNYLEREFIKVCKEAGEPFPVKKIQLKLYNPPKPNNLKVHGRPRSH